MILSIQNFKNLTILLIKHGKALNLFINDKFKLPIPFSEEIQPTIGYFIDKAGAIHVNNLKIYSDIDSNFSGNRLSNIHTTNLVANIYDNFKSDKTKWDIMNLPYFRTEIKYDKYNIITSTLMENTVLREVDLKEDDDFSIETKFQYKGAYQSGNYGVIWNVFNNKIFQGVKITNNKAYYVDQTISSNKKFYLNNISPNQMNKIQIIKSGNSLYFFINDIFSKQLPSKKFLAKKLGFYFNSRGGLSIDYIKVFSGSFAKITPDELKSNSESKNQIALKNKENFHNGDPDSININELSSIETKLPVSGVKLENTFSSSLPPILKIEDISFSKPILKAGEKSILKLIIKNIGPGDAKDVYLDIQSSMSELIFNNHPVFPLIKASGGSQALELEINGSNNLPTSMALLKINIIEPHFKVKIQGKQIKFHTKEFQNPKLILARFEVVEGQSANPNNEINTNEIIDVKLAIQNLGEGSANDVKVNVANYQAGILLLGVVEDTILTKKDPVIGIIEGGGYHTVTYRYFINSEFTDNQLQFHISLTEKFGKFGFNVQKDIPTKMPLKGEGYIRMTNFDSNLQSNNTEIIIEDIPDFGIDVDTNIPIAGTTHTNRYALIIGNEDYKSKQNDLTYEQNVEFAVNDARSFALYSERIIGIPKRQIKFLTNATSAEMQRALEWIINLSSIENGNAELYFYYSGHGIPDPNSKESYLIPVDVSGNNLKYAIKLQDLYNKLSSYPTKNITIFLDACFSGGGRDQGLLAIKGIKIKPKEDALLNNMVVFASSTGEESSNIYREKKHGYFTYFLLKKLKETKGKINYKDLSTYIINNVRKEAGLKGIIQTPKVKASPQIENSWSQYKFQEFSNNKL